MLIWQKLTWVISWDLVNVNERDGKRERVAWCARKRQQHYAQNQLAAVKSSCQLALHSHNANLQGRVWWQCQKSLLRPKSHWNWCNRREWEYSHSVFAVEVNGKHLCTWKPKWHWSEEKCVIFKNDCNKKNTPTWFEILWSFSGCFEVKFS